MLNTSMVRLMRNPTPSVGRKQGPPPRSPQVYIAPTLASGDEFWMIVQNTIIGESQNLPF